MLLLILCYFSFVIPYFECTLDYGERCGGSENFKSTRRTYLEVSREVCDESSLLYAGMKFCGSFFFSFYLYSF